MYLEIWQLVIIFIFVPGYIIWSGDTAYKKGWYDHKAQAWTESDN